jgi:hypothetical protein
MLVMLFLNMVCLTVALAHRLTNLNKEIRKRRPSLARQNSSAYFQAPFFHPGELLDAPGNIRLKRV